MPGFNFRLERVLEVKKYNEDKLKTQLAHLKREYLQQENLLWSLQEDLQTQIFLLGERQKNLTLTIEEIIWGYNYIVKLRENIENQKKRLNELNEEIKEVTKKLIGASQEKQILENLKERKFEEFKLGVEKQEQEFMDEVGISRYVKRMGSPMR
ncbi:MAG: flagellar export protein FliJ [bacterium]